eukprot:CAMPEP_0175813586 /NCGR_PEP_ID=MMETSP0107_2-20121207/4976_1 /TAXON_ID=195067 ORGANISM="Goniomonas pacifica, Strain CCMP1869" /NCGR_SAMPLE_ID=MMETSP0107_2 /ASSEMBLY_ACC=CAM_ASM_000203 /LENGTH=129 /DNA_ID=CAMNT_0017125499 /DNA_START=595 /DNA_END=984 /DNA_ORIENTATION=+
MRGDWSESSSDANCKLSSRGLQGFGPCFSKPVSRSRLSNTDGAATTLPLRSGMEGSRVVALCCCRRCHTLPATTSAADSLRTSFAAASTRRLYPGAMPAPLSSAVLPCATVRARYTPSTSLDDPLPLLA